MAGSIFGLGMSQRVDSNGKPAVGWLLSLYAQNTSTPIDTYLDTALTVKNPWPIPADAFGMIPPFWVPDGAYRVRGTTSDASIVFFDIPSVLALGASSGAVISGGVDPNAIYQVGDVMWLDQQGTRAGWVRDNGRTIGNASSSATERPNADCQALFVFLWNTFSDSICPVSSGRGANGLADFTASKTITLPDKRGCIPGGLSDMGNSDNSAWSGLPFSFGSGTTPGSKLGEAFHLLNINEIPSHNHAAVVNDPGHIHTTGQSYLTGGSSGITVGASSGSSFGQLNNAVSVHTTGIAVTINAFGGGLTHPNAQPTILGTFYRKL